MSQHFDIPFMRHAKVAAYIKAENFILLKNIFNKILNIIIIYFWHALKPKIIRYGIPENLLALYIQICEFSTNILCYNFL